ncbi:putative multi antimicrobial extrusion protein [Helianthus annuus]|uniref:Protein DETOXIFICATION n=1 Tax=Helianthus annuus TaxID=4232 RepID=A0A251VAT0_HELAN|nr:protein DETOXIFICATION 55 [Helianthus annuus]KAF5816326.1 putative multi antimicrobial extrusion protein [Helianthus annuus]KAJ0594641.1 putative multi antimicrobial extrusion protein [Helianthus annuus]KAJ0602896.1 putative multi antimicrobial extrusion protein [Helianthus annuus]KAJ0609688.1 putative multi antimicrobial extrusion protein [Helianthus annuus]KAJ0769738.1 putative multi antimicrobial extrusion protein [Helianthus annuus]
MKTSMSRIKSYMSIIYKQIMPDYSQINLVVPMVMEEMKMMSSIGFPLFTMGLVSYLKNMTSVACMGRLGRLELAGGALAIGFTNITGYSVLSGLAMGMEPLCSQAFGSRNLHMVNLTLQRTILMLLFASLPIGILWVNLEPIMLKLHQDPEITHVASLYCLYAAPDLLVNCILNPLRIFLRINGKTWPLMWCSLLSAILHFPITNTLAFNLNLGIQGIAFSTIITNLSTSVFILGYMFFTHTHKSEPWSEQESIGEGWGVLFRLAVSSCLAVCSEWWWYELMTFLSGYLHKPYIALATSAIVIQTTSLMYTLPSALSMSISTRVGHELGAGEPGRARLATLVAIVLALLTSAFGLLGIAFGKEAWGKVFTSDSEVLELTMAALPIIGVCELANCPQTTCSGVLRGSARPSIGARINLCSFYLVGTPIAVILAFVWPLGFLGLCYGLLAAQVACVLSILMVIYRTDWEKESLNARQLVGRSEYRIMECEQGIGFI